MIGDSAWEAGHLADRDPMARARDIGRRAAAGLDWINEAYDRGMAAARALRSMAPEPPAERDLAKTIANIRRLRATAARPRPKLSIVRD